MITQEDSDAIQAAKLFVQKLSRQQDDYYKTMLEHLSQKFPKRTEEFIWDYIFNESGYKSFEEYAERHGL